MTMETPIWKEVWAKIAITKTKKCLSTHISAIYGSIIVQHSPAMEQEDPTIYSMSWSKNGGLTRSLIDNLNGTVADQPLDLGHLVFRQKTGHSMFIELLWKETKKLFPFFFEYIISPIKSYKITFLFVLACELCVMLSFRPFPICL